MDTMHNESAITSGDGTPPYTDDSRASWLIVSTAVCLSVTLMFVLLRVYVRAIVIKSWGADDSLVVVSFVSFVDGTGMQGTTKGLGMHIWTIPIDVQQDGRRGQVTIGATLCYSATFIAVKMAVLLQFRRVFAVPKFRLVCNIMFGFICCFGIAVVVSSIVMAAPTWRGDTFQAETYDQGAWWLATSSVHLATDIIIFLMPIPMLHRLKLRAMLKVALMVSFGLGFITTAISIVRIVTITHVFTADVTWDVIPALVWSQVEVCCAVICVCIPTLRPLLRVVGRNTDSQKISYESGSTRLTRRPLKATTTVSSEQTITSPDYLEVMEIEPRSRVVEHSAGGLMVRTAISPALTAGGESDDGSDGFIEADEEVGTPLSPPPKSYSSPTRNRFSLPQTPEDEESVGSRG
ncbi:integral membrane protein [Colletotrichum kahawae]|uniref:Integral membrane protein n=1 Tax=Colletotrichum kahawae TaxID=34407 RepID=A0AAE0CZ33_COLKA|nr:integral membrane protein [Colletotrichum kahawae]